MVKYFVHPFFVCLHFLLLQVLKTIALHRMGKGKDAFALSEEIVALEPTDENSLQGLSLYFKEIRKSKRLFL